MTELERIKLLKTKLLDLGYYKFQIDEIYREALGDCNYNSLNSEQYQLLRSFMEDYVEFAKRCLQSKINKSKNNYYGYGT